MNKLSEFLIQQFLKKVMTCYCMDCVKKITEDTSRQVSIIHTAPKLITFADTKLANPDGCLCLECIKLYAPNHTYTYHGKEILKFNDYPYYYEKRPDSLLSCWCYKCTDEYLYIWKMYTKSITKMIKFEDITLYDTEIPYIELSKLKYTGLSKIKCPIDSKNNILYINQNNQEVYVYHIDWNEISWDSVLDPDETISNRKGIDIIKEIGIKYKSVADKIYKDSYYYVTEYYDDYGYLEDYTRRKEVPDYKWNRDTRILSEENIPKELHGNHDKIKKIIYYEDEEYLGYKLKYIDDSDGYYEIEGPPSISGHTFAADIIKYKTFEVANKNINKTDRDKYYRIIDQYCYECNKYKGACLGHIYPDANEFKYVINQSPYISQLECRIMHLEQLVLQK